mgnify:FL=1
MALQTSTGYVRITNISLGADNTTLTVSWLTFHNSNWRENNPQRRWSGINENGSYTFDLAIKEIQLNENGEETEIITGYLPQDIPTAHELLRNLDVKEAKFKGINFQIV